jgi:hypothetical protein
MALAEVAKRPTKTHAEMKSTFMLGRPSLCPAGNTLLTLLRQKMPAPGAMHKLW